MSAANREFGNWGEEVAARHLMRGDYHLLHRNWTSGHLEIDLVAEWFGEIVFVEVKTRSDETLAIAEEAVDFEKRERLVRAAKAYMAYFRLDRPFRFDVIAVVGSPAACEVRHVERAFTPESVQEERRRRHLPRPLR